jgi:quinol monooxygenase YgiN
MSEPIVFVSHFRLKPGAIDGFRQLSARTSVEIRDQKPGTLVYLLFAGPDGASTSIVHVFPDADAFDRHVVGADRRSAEAYKFIEPAGWEIYGRPNQAVLDMLRAGASRAGVPLTLEPEPLGGFVRAAPARGEAAAT